MRTRTLFTLISVLLIGAVVTTGCFNKEADAPGTFWKFWTWGDQTAAQTLAEDGWTLWSPEMGAPEQMAIDECVTAPQPEGWYSYIWKDGVQFLAYDCADVREFLKSPSQPSAGAMSCISDDSVTNFAERGKLVVNNVQVALQVRDAQCPRAIYHDETGTYDPSVAHSGEGNWTLSVGDKWVIAFAATSCYVQPAGQPGIAYPNSPFILIYGPWDGYVGCFEAGVHGTVSEWEDFLTGVILPIHESEVGHRVTPTIIGQP